MDQQAQSVSDFESDSELESDDKWLHQIDVTSETIEYNSYNSDSELPASINTKRTETRASHLSRKSLALDSLDVSDDEEETCKDLHDSSSDEDILDAVIEFFHPKHQPINSLTNEDVISLEESDLRIIKFLISLSLLLSIALLSQVIWCSIDQNPMIIDPQIPQEDTFGNFYSS